MNEYQERKENVKRKIDYIEDKNFIKSLNRIIDSFLFNKKVAKKE